MSETDDEVFWDDLLAISGIRCWCRLWGLT